MSHDGIWLLASAVLGHEVGTGGNYPHVHQDRRAGRRGCGACFAFVPDDAGPVRHGEGGHACAPAGRGTTEDAWTCPECGARWRAVMAKKAGVVTRTWERA